MTVFSPVVICFNPICYVMFCLCLCVARIENGYFGYLLSKGEAALPFFSHLPLLLSVASHFSLSYILTFPIFPPPGLPWKSESQYKPWC